MSTITVTYRGKKNEYSFSPGSNLLRFLRENGYPVNAPCGGNGTCGKCTVLLEASGSLCPVPACQTVLTDACSVSIPDVSDDISWNAPSAQSSADSRIPDGAVGQAPSPARQPRADGNTPGNAHGAAPAQSSPSAQPPLPGQNLAAAVDLGSTTVALSLLDLSTGRRLASVSRWNAQQSYGADVISRISYCMAEPEGLSCLSGVIRRQISEMLQSACASCGASLQSVSSVFLAGNTVMQHIFAGLRPDSIASAPFIPLSLFDDGQPVDLNGLPVFLSPCVAGYVGGDITAGLLSTHLCDAPSTSLFIDIGTNGEMALLHHGRLTACAVACGPAFEGANISCGMPASKGAVSKVDLQGGSLSFSVIGSGEAEGLCGSGLLDLVSCLLDLGRLDDSGCLTDDEGEDSPAFALTPAVSLTQKDIRQLQLAKAAVAAGIRTLLEAEHLSADAVDAVYLAGGFGNSLRPASAVRIGLLPSAFSGKVIPCGNTSLAGAEEALLRPAARADLLSLSRRCHYIELSTDPSFSDRFVDELSFPEA